MIRHFLNPPNWFTSASIFCSTFAVSTLIGVDPTPSQIGLSCILVIFGGIFDMLDGRVARLTNRYTEFGVQLDSIADMVGFGLAPAMIAWAWILRDLGWIGKIIAFWYVLAAAFRLARFNVNTVVQTWTLPGHSQGLTSTMSGGVLCTLIWACNGTLRDYFSPPPWAIGAFVALLGLLMVSSIPFRNFKDLKQSKMARRYVALTLGACLAGAVLIDPSLWWAIGAGVYLVVGLIDGIVIATHRQILARAFLVEEFQDVIHEAFVEEAESMGLDDEI